MNSNALKYWIAFSQIRKIGPASFKKILNYFENVKNAWEAGAVDLMQAGLPEDLAHEIIIARGKINPDEEWEKLAREKIGVLTLGDENYPKLLKEVYDPPFLLFYQGEKSILNRPCVAVVGTGKFSQYGKQAAMDLAGQLARGGITVVSGLALGIDALAHQATLEANGLTAAVLGAGLDKGNIYPAANRFLAEKIIESGGCLLSEYPPGTEPAKYHFPLRNRIIAGLSLGTLIIEAREVSGSLITARYALDNNREVFAVPGNIYSDNSRGANNLIKQGAKMVLSANDIMEELNLQPIKELTAEKIEINGTPEEKLIVKILSKEPTHVDKIAQTSKIRINVLSGLLAILELKGLIQDLGGNNYILK